MLSAITRGRVTSCCSLVTWTAVASSSLFNAASDWAGSCVIITKRRRDRTPQGSIPNSDWARCDWQIEEAEAVLLPVVSTQAPRYSCDTYELQVLPPFQFFGPTGYKAAVGNYVIVYEVGKDEVVILYVRHGARRRPWKGEWHRCTPNCRGCGYKWTTYEV